MDAKSALKSIQEQALASWITFLNQMRIDALIEKLSQQDIYLESALQELNELKASIAEWVVNRNRGGEKGMHGFIGERMQVSLKNAQNLIDGLKKEYYLIDDNGSVDYLRNLTPIQQKCVQDNFGISAIKEHLSKYPNFLDEGGVYQIPKDYYEKLKSIWSLTPEEAGRLTKSDYKLWKNLQSFFNETRIDPGKIEPMDVDYSEIQKETYNQTIKDQEKQIKAKDQENRDKAYQKSKPSVKQGAQAAAVGAGIEGGLAFCMAIAEKHKQGKKVSEYKAEDWKDVGSNTGLGILKGGIRGGSIYVMSNFMATPANVASALITATYGMISQGIKLAKGEISQEDFIINSEACCMDAGVSAVSALMGEILIPVPVLGAVIGSSVGNFMYGIAQKYCSENVKKCVEAYYTEINELNKALDEKYQYFTEYIDREFKKYSTILELAFDNEINVSFENSILLARMSGVEEERILKTVADIDNFFMN
jgi:hypothetical protein